MDILIAKYKNILIIKSIFISRDNSNASPS